MKLISKDGRKAVPRLRGTGKNPGGILLMSITTKTYPALIDRGKPDKKSDWASYSRHDFQNSLALLQLDRLQLTAVYCNRRECVNIVPPNTEKWLRKRLRENNGYGIWL